MEQIISAVLHLFTHTAVYVPGVCNEQAEALSQSDL